MRVWIATLVAFMVLLQGQKAFAGTDLLSNALTQSNSYLKQAGLVQKKYSGIARKILTTKVSLSLDNINLGRAEKYKEKAEIVKEKADKVQDRLETAKERKEELLEKYNNLNAKAMEYKAMADEAIAEGNEIRDMYRSYKSDVEDIIDTGKEVSDTIKEATGADDNIKEAVPAENTETAVEDSEAEVSDIVVQDEEIEPTSATPIAKQAETVQAISNDNRATFMPAQRIERVTDTPQTAISTATITPAETIVASPEINSEHPIIAGKAEAITSAAVLAQDATKSQQISVPTQFDNVEQSSSMVSISDVMKAAADNKAMPKAAVEAKSSMSIQQQLSKNSGVSTGASSGKITAEGLVLTPSVNQQNISKPTQQLEKANVR